MTRRIPALFGQPAPGRTALCALALCGALLPGLAGAAAEDPPRGGGRTDDADPLRAEAVDDKVAKGLLAQEKKALASREPRLRMEALNRLSAYSNELLVKAFEGALRDKDTQVVIAALQGIANQPGEKASKPLLRLLKAKRFQEDAQLGTALVKALAGTGWGKSGYELLREAFDEALPPVKKEILRAFIARKELQAFSLFVDNLDEPRPASVNAANNPPASYWKARFKEWRFIEAEVRKGLETLSERKFSNAEEAREWAKTREARKLKIRYKRGA